MPAGWTQAVRAILTVDGTYGLVDTGGARIFTATSVSPGHAWSAARALRAEDATTLTSEAGASLDQGTPSTWQA